MKPKKLGIVIILLIFSFLVVNLNKVNADNETFLKVEREITVNAAHLIVKDKITVLNKTDRIPVYLSEYEYISLYTIWVMPQKPVQWGLFYEESMGFI